MSGTINPRMRVFKRVIHDADTFEPDDSTEIPPSPDSHDPGSVVVSSGLFNVVGNVSLGLSTCRFLKKTKFPVQSQQTNP